MSSVPYLLSRGDGKLGENIFHWSVPAVETCPGRSQTCERHCYARNGRYRTTRVKEQLRSNLAASQAGGFVTRMVREIERRWCQVVRAHVAGDFYSPEYTAKWREVAELCDETTFYAYTRSYRDPSVAPELAALAALPNVRLWYSAHEDTGMPTEVPRNVRVAWMLATDDEQFEMVDVVIRVRCLRGDVSRRVNLSLVCPTENGTNNDTDCGACGHCWK